MPALDLLQRHRRRRLPGLIHRGLAVGAVSVNGSMVLVAGMGLGNGRRQRKHDQDDRRSENPQYALRQHGGLVVAQVPARYRRQIGNSRRVCGGELGALLRPSQNGPPFDHANNPFRAI